MSRSVGCRPPEPPDRAEVLQEMVQLLGPNHASKRAGSRSEPQRFQAATKASWVASSASARSPRITAASRAGHSFRGLRIASVGSRPLSPGRRIVQRMKGDRVEAVVDTGQGVQTFEIVATRAGRRIEVVTARGVVEVREVTRSGQPVRTGRFMTSRLIALVEHPAADERGRVEVTTRHRLQPRGGS